MSITLEAFLKSMKTDKGNLLSEATIRDYIQRVNKIYKILNINQPISINDIVKDLLNNDNVITKLDVADVKNKQLYYMMIIRILNHVGNDDYRNIIDKHYYPLFIKHKGVSEAPETLSDIKDSKTNKFMPLHEVLDHIGQYVILTPNSQIMTKALIYKLLVCFYFQNPCYIPRGEIRTLKVVSSKEEKLSDDENYLVLNGKNQVSHILLNRYKTYRHYGSKKMKVSAEVKNLLKLYLEHVPRDSGDYLFVNKNNMPYSESSYSTILGQAFLNVLGRPMTLEVARQIQVEHFNTTMPTASQRKKFAQACLHSVDVGKRLIDDV